MDTSKKSMHFVCIFLQICSKFELLPYQSSAATNLRCGSRYYKLLQQISYIFQQWKLFKLVKVWEDYTQQHVRPFLGHSVEKLPENSTT